MFIALAQPKTCAPEKRDVNALQDYVEQAYIALLRSAPTAYR